MHDRLALAGPRQSNHGRPWTDYLPGFGQRLHHHPIGIGNQHRITRSIPGHVGLRHRRIQLRPGRVGVGL